MYLRVNHANVYIDSTDENKDLLKKYKDVWNGIKTKIKIINVGEYHYEKRLHGN